MKEPGQHPKSNPVAMLAWALIIFGPPNDKDTRWSVVGPLVWGGLHGVGSSWIGAAWASLQWSSSASEVERDVLRRRGAGECVVWNKQLKKIL